MDKTIDIDRVLAKSTRKVSIDDLSKQGLKQVKVLKHSTITRVITETVDRIIRERSESFSTEERQRAIKEAEAQIARITQEKERERDKVSQLASKNTDLLTQAEELRKKLDALSEGDHDKKLAIEEQVAGIAKKNEALQTRVLKLEAELEVKSGALDSAQEKIVRVAELEGRLEAREEEIARLREGGGASSEFMEKMYSGLCERIEKSGGGGGAGLQESLQKLQQGLMKMSGSASFFADQDPEAAGEALLETLFSRDDTDTGVDSNVSDVKVKHAKAGGVKGSLAKLRELQRKEGEE